MSNIYGPCLSSCKYLSNKPNPDNFKTTLRVCSMFRNPVILYECMPLDDVGRGGGGIPITLPRGDNITII